MDTGAGVLDRIVGREREIARLWAEQLRDISEFSVASGLDESGVIGELGLAFSVSSQAARNLLDLARALVERLPGTFGALERGEIDLYKASKVAEPTAVLSDELARSLDSAVAGRLSGRDAASIRRLVSRVIQKVDPDGSAERAEARRARRRIELRHADEGMAKLVAELPAEQASAAYARIDEQAHALRRAGDRREFDQLRADVLVERLLGESSSAGSVKAQVFVHVDLPMLTGLAENPGELAGHGPLPASIARAIAFDPKSTWRRIVTDPLSGAPIDVGRNCYRPPAVTADHARVRDRECVFPGCHRPAHYTDLDTSKRGNTAARQQPTISTASAADTTG